jgi:hypothetical protein
MAVRALGEIPASALRAYLSDLVAASTVLELPILPDFREYELHVMLSDSQYLVLESGHAHSPMKGTSIDWSRVTRLKVSDLREV